MGQVDEHEQGARVTLLWLRPLQGEDTSGSAWPTGMGTPLVLSPGPHGSTSTCLGCEFKLQKTERSPGTGAPARRAEKRRQKQAGTGPGSGCPAQATPKN